MDLANFALQVEKRDFPITWPGNFIAGEWQPNDRGTELSGSSNPNDGTRLVKAFTHKDSVLHAVECAENSRGKIAELSIDERIDILKRFRQTFADYETLTVDLLRIESGKPRWEAEEDLAASLAYIDNIIEHKDDYFKSLLGPATLGNSSGDFRMNPIGVTVAYLPFSTPLTGFTFYFTAAVMAGCPLILVSSSHAILNSMLYAFAAEMTNAPKNLLNVIFGNYSSFKTAVSDNRVAAVLYTGSREHCDSMRKDARNRSGRQLVLQSGGKNAVIVHSSADLEIAVNCVMYGALKSAGQRCTTTSRVFVYKDHVDEFNERLVEAFKKIKIGRTDLDNEDSDPFMGPLYSAKSVEKFLRFQTMANRESDKTLLWGKAIETAGNGHFVSPGLHFINEFDNLNAYQSNVLFSPDVAIYPYSVLESAIERLNTTDAAFAVSFIGDPAIIESRRTQFLAPNLLINTPTVELEATLPLAGRLQSGHHRFHGPGIALYLCYPQVLVNDENQQKSLSSWPWPKY
jgi:acyl-CoA reductase-like NAD-dependent aldehyde dehydrogenase